MRIPCPHCGERGSEEFTYLGGVPGPRPAMDAAAADWHAYVHLRANPRGTLREYWHHAHGCRRWLIVTRDTLTHAVHGAEDARPEEHAA